MKTITTPPAIITNNALPLSVKPTRVTLVSAARTPCAQSSTRGSVTFKAINKMAGTHLQQEGCWPRRGCQRSPGGGRLRAQQLSAVLASDASTAHDMASRVGKSDLVADIPSQPAIHRWALLTVTGVWTGLLSSWSAAPAAAQVGDPAVGDVAVGLDFSVQLLYLGSLLVLLALGAFLVVRQILIQRELEETAKQVGEKVRSGAASSEEYFELGVVLLRKKAYGMAVTNLERALNSWEGPLEEQAQAFNALGFAKYKQEKYEEAVPQYRRAVELQPGYVTAWNNLGNSYEKLKQLREALAAYDEALLYAPDNEVAGQRATMLRNQLKRLKQL